MSAIRFVFTGDKEMKKNLEAYAREFPLAARRGTREYAQELLSEIVPGVPFKTGKLAGSGRVRVSIKKTAGTESIAASIVFGGAAYDILYARKVHEHNPKHPEQEKFLERPLLAKVPTAGAAIAEKVALKKAALK
jgi:hypothetical protein